MFVFDHRIKEFHCGGIHCGDDALSSTGNNVIADCPVYSEKLEQYFKKYLGPIQDKVTVKVECPLVILEERERTRGDRSVGIAKKQYDGIRKYLNFDLKVDSSKSSPIEMATAILKVVR